jgi:hypothetical protein
MLAARRELPSCLHYDDPSLVGLGSIEDLLLN